jgi:hypothetical protein
MPRIKYSVQESLYFTPIIIEGLSVRERVAALEAHLPVPATQDEARRRVINGLRAISKMSCMLMEQIDEDSEFGPPEYWVELCAELEGRFQGNITQMLRRKLYKFRLATEPVDEDGYPMY